MVRVILWFQDSRPSLQIWTHTMAETIDVSSHRQITAESLGMTLTNGAGG